MAIIQTGCGPKAGTLAAQKFVPGEIPAGVTREEYKYFSEIGKGAIALLCSTNSAIDMESLLLQCPQSLLSLDKMTFTQKALPVFLRVFADPSSYPSTPKCQELHKKALSESVDDIETKTRPQFDELFDGIQLVQRMKSNLKN